MNQKDISRSRKFKYGSVAMLFTVTVIAAVIVLNVVVTALTQTFSLYVDMTSSDMYSISEACSGIMDELVEEHRDDVVPLHYNIIFCSPFDTLEGSQSSSMVYNFALKLQAQYPDLIDIKYIDIITHPSLAEQYTATTADTVRTTDVIVESATGYRKFLLEAFYVTAESDGSIFAFNAELKFVGAFLQLAGEYNPVAVFLDGHSESDSSAMQMLFDSAGFDVMTLNLQKGSEDGSVAPGELPEYAKVLIINNPLYDYIGANGDGLVNEIAVIDEFLEIKEDGSSGNLIVFMNNNSAGKLPELEEYLVEWGFQFGRATLQDKESATSVDGQTIIATLPTEGVGSSLHTSLRALPSVPMTIVKNACPIYQVFQEKEDRIVSSVLTTTKTAEAYPNDGEGEPVRGQFDLMTVARECRYIDNQPCYANVLVCGSADFANSAYIAQRQYGNSDILFSVMREFGKDQVPIDIDFKVFDDIGLNISTQQANGWTAVLITVVPAIMLIWGVAVYIRRKHL
ncbi:MAG: hypothetical protein IJC98_07955 [Clostridia bacterium]|nr:hypothetical protein [Clostridia bacterium]